MLNTIIRFPESEADIRDLAVEYGLKLPTYSRAQCPQLFEAWADRVEMVGVKSQDHKLSGGDIAEANAYAGR
jgi:hypothetical protein